MNKDKMSSFVLPGGYSYARVTIGDVVDLHSYSHYASQLAIYPQMSALVYPTLGLVGEAGEVAEKVKKLIRDTVDLDLRVLDTDVEHLEHEIKIGLLKELGDVLWYVNAAARDLGYNLQDVAQLNLYKLYDRKARDKLHGEGDER